MRNRTVSRSRAGIWIRSMAGSAACKRPRDVRRLRLRLSPRRETAARTPAAPGPRAPRAGPRSAPVLRADRTRFRSPPACARPPCSGGRSRGSPGSRFGRTPGNSAPSTPVSCMARSASGAVRQGEACRRSAGHSGRGAPNHVGQPRQLSAMRCSASAESRTPCRATNSKARSASSGSASSCCGARKIDPVARDAEIGVGEPRAPVAERGQQPAALALRGLQRAHAPRAPPRARGGSTRASTPPRRAPCHSAAARSCASKRQHVIVAPRPAVQVAAQPRQERERLAQLRPKRRSPACRIALQPGEQLVVAQPAGAFLDIRLQVVEGAAGISRGARA